MEEQESESNMLAEKEAQATMLTKKKVKKMT